MERPLAVRQPDRTLYVLGDDAFVFECEDAKCQFHVDRFHYDRFGQARATVWVETCLAGTIAADDGVLGLFDDISLSKREDKQRIAQQLQANSRTKSATVDWQELVEDLSLRVRLKAQKGKGSIRLSDARPAPPDPCYEVDGLQLQKHQPTVFAGPGDTGKSYLSLYLAGRLQQAGARVLFLDYEMDEHAHRVRLESLFGEAMPDIRYLRMSRPLVIERPRIANEIHEHGITYLVVDSVGQACRGRLTEEDSANDYTRTLRTFDKVGSLSIAHMPKSRPEERDVEGSIFGSIYFFNNARTVFHLRQVPEASGDNQITVAVLCKKSNLGRKQKSVGFELQFGDDRAKVSRVDLADLPSVARQLPLMERLRHTLKHGARTMAEIEASFDGENVESVKRKLRSGLNPKGGKPALFVRVPSNDGIERIALAENRYAA